MSTPKPGALFVQSLVSEISAVARKPSWIARRMSTTPPIPTAPLRPSIPAAGSESPDAAAREGEAAGAAPALQPPPPPAVDLATSMALAQLADENAALRAQITEMAATMARLQRDVLESSEGELVKLALAIAERVVGRELASDPGLVASWAREAIEALAAKDGVVIAVARDVRDGVPADAWDAVGVEHRIQSDPQLPPGAVEVRTAEGTVAAGADARLEAVALALGVEDR